MLKNSATHNKCHTVISYKHHTSVFKFPSYYVTSTPGSPLFTPKPLACSHCTAPPPPLPLTKAAKIAFHSWQQDTCLCSNWDWLSAHLDSNVRSRQIISELGCTTVPQKRPMYVILTMENACQQFWQQGSGL